MSDVSAAVLEAPPVRRPKPAAGRHAPATLVIWFLARRVVRMLISLVIVSMITFGLLQMAPGTFAGIRAAGGGSTGLAQQVTQDASAELDANYGSDVPVIVQYWNWFSRAVTLNFGASYKYPDTTVTAIVANALPVSASLALLAMGLALIIAVPVGLIAATKKGTWWDNGLMFITTLGVGLPNYLSAIVLVLVFAVGLHLLPTGGWSGPQNMILPVLALAIAPIGSLARYVRSSVLEALHEEYVVAARAKGGSWRTVMVHHVLRNSMIPLVTVVGPSLAVMMTGTIFIEQIFSIPGLGLYTTNAAVGRDMPLLMGTTMTFAAILMLMNLVVDLVYAVLDPRTKAGLGLTPQLKDGTS